MPEECLQKMHEGYSTDCRKEVSDHCKSVVESDSSDDIIKPLPSRSSFVATDECQECIAAYERDGGCQHALNRKWYIIRMPRMHCRLRKRRRVPTCFESKMVHHTNAKNALPPTKETEGANML